MRRLNIQTSVEQTAGDERVIRLSQTPLIKSESAFCRRIASHLRPYGMIESRFFVFLFYFEMYYSNIRSRKKQQINKI